MKNLKIIFLNLLLIFGLTLLNNSANAQLKVVNNKVGINKSNPAYTLDVNGTVRASTYRSTSNYLNLRTNHGSTNIGAGNQHWSHFLTDRPAFWLQKETQINGHFKPYSSNAFYCGSNSKRWLRGYFTTVYRIQEFSLSDKNAKENFRQIENPLNKILQLDGKLYDYKAEVFMPTISEQQKVSEAKLSKTNQADAEKYDIETDKIDTAKLKVQAEKSRKNHYGFIAQEVKDIVPEAVEYNEETGLYSMSYTALIPILVEAVKEQQKQIDELKAALGK